MRVRNFVAAFRNWLAGPIPFSTLLAFLIGALLLMLASYSPLVAYGAMVNGSLLTSMGIANTLQRAIPLIGMAMATAIAFRSGILNIGTEGQMIMGGLAGALVAIYMPGPGPLVMICALLAGAAGGALWALVAGLLQFWPGVPILITSLLLAYPARFLSSWLVRHPFKDPDASIVATVQIRPEVQIPLLIPPGSTVGEWATTSFGSRSVISVVGSSINWSILLVIAVVIAVAYINKNTVFGFEAGIYGQNPLFARYGGGNDRRLTLSVMALSGAVAGLMGISLTIGAPSTRLIDGALITNGYAWTGLMVALLAMYRPYSVLAAGLFFGAVMAGAGAMSRELGMSPQIAAVIQGVVIVLIVFKTTPPRLFRRRKSVVADKSPTHPPESNSELTQGVAR